jgi:succinate dehydrogenase/fumarate reductase flavoprotein subunit
LDEIAVLRARLQRAMSRHVGVVRDAAGLARAREDIENIAAELRLGSARETQASDANTRRAFWELRNLVDAARTVIAAADHRQESRGAHYRADFPDPNSALDGQHSLRLRDGSYRFGAVTDAFATPAE